jgi:vancomycin resistance protein VanJ
MSSRGNQRYRIPIAGGPPTPAASRWSRKWALRPIVVAATWLNAAALLGAWGAVRMSPHDFWPAHLFFYGPRWLLTLPSLVLATLAIRLRLRRSAPALATAALAFVAVWGLNLPWGETWREGEQSLWTLRLLTCNVQFEDLRTRELSALIRSTRPDIVLLQEWGFDDPLEVIGRVGWHVRSEGEFCLASRYPIVDFEALRRPDEESRVIAVRAKILWCGRAIPVVDVHLMTPRKGLEAILQSPIGGLDAFRHVAGVQEVESGLLRRWVEEPTGEILLAGDFNLTAEHPLYRRDWHVYEDTFARAGWGLGRTMFTRHNGLRIDHILTGPAWRATRSTVGPEVGSAHRPVIADIEWSGPPPSPSAPEREAP